MSLPRRAVAAPPARGRATVAVAVAWLALAAAGVAQVRPASPPEGARRVLILSSYGSDFTAMSQVGSQLRSELAALRTGPLDFYEIPLEFSRFEDEVRQEAFVGYLEALFARRRPDLVVALGGPAARFVRTEGPSLFPGAPVLYAAVDRRLLDASTLGPGDAAVPLELVPSVTLEGILELLPATEQVAIVLGTSSLERFWRAELASLLRPYEPRVRLVWLDGLPLADLRRRVAALPPRSAVLFMLLLVDGSGVTHSQTAALAAVRASSSAPVFGVFDTQLGQGVVGGRLLPVSTMGKRAAEVASRLLAGEPPESLRDPPAGPGAPRFDARELGRWRIPESRLPAGSEVFFRPDSPWKRYRWPILGALSVLGLQAASIGALLLHRARRRTAEGEILSLHGRLVSANEQERRRLARELHDDVTQRLARLVIDGAQVARQGAETAEGSETLRRMREELVRLGKDVHALSRRLHPSILDDLGLAAAVRSEAERFARSVELAVEMRIDEATSQVPDAVGLSLFRVAQEALRNVEKHARARRVEVALGPSRGGVELVVRDDGSGFDPQGARSRQGLGQLSMRERMHLVGGQLRVESAAGMGTTVRAWAPLAPASSTPEGAG